MSALSARLLKEFDANGNGKLDYSEQGRALRTLMASQALTADQEAIRSAAAARFDRNQNGKLDRSELRSAIIAANADARARSSENLAKTKQTSPRTGPSMATAARAASMTEDAATGAARPSANSPLAYDANGDGIIDAAEYSLIQAALLRQFTQAAAGGTTTGLTPSAIGGLTTGTTTGSSTAAATGAEGGEGTGTCTHETGETAGTTTATGTSGSSSSSAAAGNLRAQRAQAAAGRLNQNAAGTLNALRGAGLNAARSGGAGRAAFGGLRRGR
jgi:Ca2+-binding EF-hand superfamily protein